MPIAQVPRMIVPHPVTHKERRCVLLLVLPITRSDLISGYADFTFLLAFYKATILVDDNRLEDLKNVIREYTNNFKEIKGFMYSRPIDDYEGSI